MMLHEACVRKTKDDAEELFRNGCFNCAEAVVASIRKNVAPEMPIELIATASGFPLGAWRSKCMCGAVAGAVISIGYLFGRCEPSSPADPKSQNCLKLANELQESFRNNHKGVLCCHVLTSEVEMGSNEHKKQCVAFTGEMAAKTAEIALRELGGADGK